MSRLERHLAEIDAGRESVMQPDHTVIPDLRAKIAGLEDALRHPYQLAFQQSVCRTIGCTSLFARWWEWPHRLICSRGSTPKP